jgi:hypothetical protein
MGPNYTSILDYIGAKFVRPSVPPFSPYLKKDNKLSVFQKSVLRREVVDLKVINSETETTA